jgi:hypothetical protein
MIQTTEHEVVPARGDFFALETTCRASSCGRRALWRIGIGEWEHVDPAWPPNPSECGATRARWSVSPGGTPWTAAVSLRTSAAR